MTTTPANAHRMASTVLTTLSAVSLLALARGTAAIMAVADTATTDAGVATPRAITTTAIMGVATAITGVGMATTVATTATPGVAAAANMGPANGNPATTT